MASWKFNVLEDVLKDISETKEMETQITDFLSVSTGQ